MTTAAEATASERSPPRPARRCCTSRTCGWRSARTPEVVKGISFTARAGRVPGDRRRVRLGQERHRPHPGRADRRQSHVSADRIEFDGRDLLAVSATATGAAMRGKRHRLHPAGRARLARPAAPGRQRDRRGAAAARLGHPGRAAGAGDRAARAGRRARARGAGPAASLRALRRPAPAGADRLGDRAGPEADHRRRADHRARRDRPGAGAGAAGARPRSAAAR